MSGIRWIDNQEDLILKAVSNERRGEMTAMSVKNKHPLRMPGFVFGVSIKYILEPIQTHLIIALSSG
jgi:hypothetical protein